MAILTKHQISELNDRMLGLGAPIQYDGVGYNKVDFSKMENLGGNYHLTDRQAWFVCLTLRKYKKTQLTQWANDIEESITAYEGAKTVKVNPVEVVGVSDTQVSLTWTFDRKVSDQLKGKLDSTQYKWTKSNGTWVLNVNWGYAETINQSFVSLGLDTTSLVKAIQQHNSQPHTVKEQSKPHTAQQIVLEVSRLPKSVDTIQIKSDYDKALVAAFKSIPNMFWDNKKKVWNCYIENAAKLYDALPDGVVADQLKPWADLTRNWNKKYNLLDLSKLNLKFQPYSFQPEDAQRLMNLQTGLNGNEVGCGKTFEQVIIGESIPMKKLVICPPTLRVNWEREIHMVNADAEVHIQYSDKPYKSVDGWNIIGYHSLDKFQKQLEKEQYQVIMIDEAHFIQAVNNYGNPDSKRALAVLRLAATSQYVFPITGTPKTNRNINLYNILRVIRHPLTRGNWAFQNYGKHFCDGQKTQWGWDYTGNSNDSELNEQLKPVMVRHLKKDVLPHLKKQRQAIPVSVNLSEYQYLISEYLRTRKNKNSESLVQLNRAKQVVAIQKAQESIAFAQDIISQGKKVVIVTAFTEVVAQVEKAIKGCLKIVGGMSDKAKNAAIDEFQHGTAQAIVINIVAGGTGVTLTAASTMIVNDVSFVVGDMEQAEGRIWRSGQKETAMIYYMLANKCEMDEKLIDIIVNKSATINAVVDGGKADELNLLKLIEDIWQ